MKFSNHEIKDLIKAWFFISLAFAILFSGGYNLFLNFDVYKTIFVFIASALIVGGAFLLHELMHKFIAQKYHFWAEFRAFNSMLWLALIMSFFGFILAAPGAVMIKARILRINKEKSGKISLAGPLTNIILALIFGILLLLFFSYNSIMLKLFLKLGLTINSLLALFNLIPFRPFDGKDVFTWNKIIWGISATVSFVLYILSYFV